MENNTRIHVGRDGQKHMVEQKKDATGNWQISIIKVKDTPVSTIVDNFEQEGDNNEE